MKKALIISLCVGLQVCAMERSLENPILNSAHITVFVKYFSDPSDLTRRAAIDVYALMSAETRLFADEQMQEKSITIQSLWDEEVIKIKQNPFFQNLIAILEAETIERKSVIDAYKELDPLLQKDAQWIIQFIAGESLHEMFFKEKLAQEKDSEVEQKSNELKAVFTAQEAALIAKLEEQKERFATEKNNEMEQKFALLKAQLAEQQAALISQLEVQKETFAVEKNREMEQKFADLKTQFTAQQTAMAANYEEEKELRESVIKNLQEKFDAVRTGMSELSSQISLLQVQVTQTPGDTALYKKVREEQDTTNDLFAQLTAEECTRMIAIAHAQCEAALFEKLVARYLTIFKEHILKTNELPPFDFDPEIQESIHISIQASQPKLSQLVQPQPVIQRTQTVAHVEQTQTDVLATSQNGSKQLILDVECVTAFEVSHGVDLYAVKYYKENVYKVNNDGFTAVLQPSGVLLYDQTGQLMYSYENDTILAIELSEATITMYFDNDTQGTVEIPVIIAAHELNESLTLTDIMLLASLFGENSVNQHVFISCLPRELHSLAYELIN